MYKNLQRLVSFLLVSSGFEFFLINQIVVFSLTWIEVFDHSLFVLATAMSQRAANEISMASFPRSQVPKTMNDHTSIHLYIHTYIYIYTHINTFSYVRGIVYLNIVWCCFCLYWKYFLWFGDRFSKFIYFFSFLLIDSRVSGWDEYLALMVFVWSVRLMGCIGL